MKRTGIALVLVMALLLLTGCVSQTENEKSYIAAQELLAKGEYAQAADAFQKLGAYEDAAKLTQYCKAIAAGETEAYADAIATLTALGDFMDASMQAVYYSARQKESLGAFAAESAAELYSSIPLFRDSKERAAACLERSAALEETMTASTGDSPSMIYGGYLFRGFPWGSSVELLDSLYDVSESKDPDPMTVEQIYNTGLEYTNQFKNRGLMTKYSANYRTDYGVYVGDLFTDTWTCYYVNMPKNGRMTYDEADTFLYAARYYFSKYDQVSRYDSLDKMEKQLTSRLTDLYGTPTTPATKDATGVIMTRWEGANDTEIVLTKGEYSVYLTYLWKGGDELLAKADAATDPDSKTYKRLFMDCGGL